jgi:hypothetical protein
MRSFFARIRDALRGHKTQFVETHTTLDKERAEAGLALSDLGACRSSPQLSVSIQMMPT